MAKKHTVNCYLGMGEEGARLRDNLEQLADRVGCRSVSALVKEIAGGRFWLAESEEWARDDGRQALNEWFRVRDKGE